MQPLVHESSYSDIGSMPTWRLHNVLMAQTLYVKKSGNFIDRLLYRIYLLRHSRNVRLKHAKIPGCGERCAAGFSIESS